MENHCYDSSDFNHSDDGLELRTTAAIEESLTDFKVVDSLKKFTRQP